jgi:hypothetical protein
VDIYQRRNLEDAATRRRENPGFVFRVAGFEFRGGLVFQTYRSLYHSTLCWRVIKKEKKVPGSGVWNHDYYGSISISIPKGKHLFRRGLECAYVPKGGLEKGCDPAKRGFGFQISGLGGLERFNYYYDSVSTYIPKGEL